MLKLREALRLEHTSQMAKEANRLGAARIHTRHVCLSLCDVTIFLTCGSQGHIRLASYPVGRVPWMAPLFATQLIQETLAVVAAEEMSAGRLAMCFHHGTSALNTFFVSSQHEIQCCIRALEHFSFDNVSVRR